MTKEELIYTLIAGFIIFIIIDISENRKNKIEKIQDKKKPTKEEIIQKERRRNRWARRKARKHMKKDDI